MFEENYNKLNTEQKRAVDTIEGPVLVVAGPGSGKTQVLALRVAHILKQTDASPRNILCLTFTDAAAINMRQRLSDFIGADAYKVAIHTFHNFCTEVINRYPEFFYGGASFYPADEMGKREVLDDIFSRLPHSNPLSVKHSEKGYVYLSDSQSTIGYLKKGYITPVHFREILAQNKKELEAINPIIEKVFVKTMSKKVIDECVGVVQELRTHGASLIGLPAKSLALMTADSLERAVAQAQEEDKVTPLSQWKTKWTSKSDEGGRILKDTTRVEKLVFFADIYEAYQKEMFKRGFYDFDDMLVDVIQKIEENDVLRAEIQEQYQYVLVDEFQDTNSAQMRILELIGNAPVNEGRPNIMVVGDDDQAIYKFQGADISNILDFKERWSNPEVVVLTKNYRSRQDILDLARHIIVKGEERLENIMPEVEKKLISEGRENAKGDMSSRIFSTSVEEYSFIAKETARHIQEGVLPEDISIVTRKHKALQEIVPFLRKEGVPIRYDQQRNVFLDPHIQQLIVMARCIGALVDTHNTPDDVDQYLPEILSFPFWNVSREVVWGISLQARSKEQRAKKEHSHWLGVMRTHQDKHIVAIAEFFLSLAERASYDTWEVVFGELVGTSIDDDKGKTPFSPFKQYYFSKERLEKNPAEYLTFLSGLRVFTQALREYRQGLPLNIKDVLEFVDAHIKNDLKLLDNSPFVGAASAVHLSTVHGVKGLEFSTVFVAGCVDELWTRKGKSNMLSLPTNIPLAPVGDTTDDYRRLFYVALTRARDNLYITSHTTKPDGKEASRLQFLTQEGDVGDYSSIVREVLAGEEQQTAKGKELADTLLFPWSEYHDAPVQTEEKALLLPYIESYMMSPTHLNNFLNVSRGGPQHFFEQNILRFPQPKNSAGSYGTAMHDTLEMWYEFLREHKKQPTEKKVLEWFEKALYKERLSSKEVVYFQERGREALKMYYAQRKNTLDASHLIETNFRQQGVVLDGALVTGKIDKMVIEDNEIVVYDFKTGKAKKEWGKGSDAEKITLHNYQHQLLFYKLLVENARDFEKFTVAKGVLEFLEPLDGTVVNLELEIKEEDIERIKKLIKVVYEKIITFDFPDTEQYPKTLKGVIAFEDDLLSGAI